MSGRSASRASATAPTSSSPSMCARARRPSARSLTSDSVGGRNEAHHGGFTDDRRHFWAAGLVDQQDLHLRCGERSGQPEARQDDRRLRGEDRRGGRAARRLCAAGAHDDPERCPTRDGDRPHRARRIFQPGRFHRHPLAADGRGCKRAPRSASSPTATATTLRVLPRKNVMLTSSFTGLRELHARRSARWRSDPEAMKKFGQTHGPLGFPCPYAEEGVPCSRRAAGSTLGLGRRIRSTPSPPPP